MRLSGATVLVTGAARGLGNALVKAAIDRGAAKVYAATRGLLEVQGGPVVPVRLDITNARDVAEASRTCDDVTVLVNNAGVMRGRPVLAAPDTEAARTEMETNYFGTLAMCRAFAPVLARNGGGAMVNILSVVSWYAAPFNGSYCASKSAAWALTNAARIELRAQGTLVVGVYAGFIETDMASDVPGVKISPSDVAAQSFDGVERGAQEVLVDEHTRRTKANLPDDLTTIYPRLQAMWDSGGWS